MKIRIKKDVFFGDKTLTDEKEVEALILSNGQAIVEHPNYPGTTWIVAVGYFYSLADSVSRDGIKNAFSSLREMIGQDVKTLEFK